jgi:hypothetical protein
MTALRTDLLASLRAAPDEIDFAGSIDELAVSLKSIARRIRSAQANGARPGKGTLRRIDAVTRRLGQSTAAYRHARGM